MRILVVAKSSYLDQIGHDFAKVRPNDEVLLDTLGKITSAHDDHRRSLEWLTNGLARHSLEFDLVDRNSLLEVSVKQYEIVISVGGDGTLLAASHSMLEGGTIVGVRSSPSSVGHLCALEGVGISELVSRITADDLPRISIARLQAIKIRHQTGDMNVTVPVLNDILFANASPAGTTRYALTVGSVTEEQRSSGIWFATAVGSTAAIAAAGGQPMEIRDRRCQFFVRELYKSRISQGSFVHGFFEPERDMIQLVNYCSHGVLGLDGQHGLVNLEFFDRVQIKSGPPISLVRPWARG